ncbi:MAG: sigma 54-interacting transcriptional regulator [Planctomycetes bacterium]|nr:sigma 54-interacting transcriptional regulator [Planctomycetota bacterium]
MAPFLVCTQADALAALAHGGGYDLVLAELTSGGRELLGKTGSAPWVLLDSFGTAEDAADIRARGAADVTARPLPRAPPAAGRNQALAASRIVAENARLKGHAAFGGLASRDARMRAVLELAERVADSRAGLLIQGESGTGKTRLARAVHAASSRRDGPFIEVNCGALPGDLLVSELFGHVRGAFTGADHDRIGKFQAAHGGTIFLDEIATASNDLQVKLLRVLESSRFERIGDNQTMEVDVRVLAACNLDLRTEIEAGRFRADLFWRLNVVAIELPPLRERPGDLIDLAEVFRARFAKEHGRQLESLDPLCQALLLAHDWPGNVRELENAIERAVLFSRGEALLPEDFGPLFDNLSDGSKRTATVEHLPSELRALVSADPGPLKAALEAPEAYLVRRALDAAGGNRQRTAAILDINRSTLFNKMRKHGLSDFPTDTSCGPAAGTVPPLEDRSTRP